MFVILSTPHGALGTFAARLYGLDYELLSTPHGALGTTSQAIQVQAR